MMNASTRKQTAAADFVSELGIAVLPHQVRRMLDRLREEVDLGDPELMPRAPYRAYSTVLLLEAHGPLGIVEIAERLRLSHPLITRFAGELAELGLVREQRSARDGRFRLLRLSAKGRRDAERIARYHELCAAAFEELSTELGIDLLAVSQRVRQALDERPLRRRVLAQVSEGSAVQKSEGS